MNSDKAEDYYKTAIHLHGVVNQEKIFELYARSAELGNAAAQYNIAMMYSNGESVWVDYQQAVYWFRKSAAQGFSPAQYRLGEMYLFEKGGLAKDLKKAIALFEQAAAQHDADAQMNLAMLNGTGEGMPLNTDKALYWILRADKVGNESADRYRDLLAESKGTGFSIEQKKYYWTKKAAELGIIEAQKALIILDAK
ncbi:MAG: sel1 repeat family protein [Xanthomonadales bacterium]|nr:sel1 repeat family protein [Xanthomonadales bacterium]